MTPSRPASTPRRILLLGSGELGKEVTISLKRLGREVIAVDSYPDAPAMQVADSRAVIDMTDPDALRALVDVQVGAADAGGLHADLNLTGFWVGDGVIFQTDVMLSVKNCCFHNLALLFYFFTTD